ncbi:hypothetical protein GCM10025789_12860 [Tessaracoccus lubricantis]|uniref:Uncharacterized protein n=1 Tax=Tessaracoccus lubricantis TaxID=545543 RepID=A0ABP9FAE7_9ACTN
MFWLNGDLTARTMADVRLAVVLLLLGRAVVLVNAATSTCSLGDATAETSPPNNRPPQECPC